MQDVVDLLSLWSAPWELPWRSAVRESEADTWSFSGMSWECALALSAPHAATSSAWDVPALESSWVVARDTGG